MEIIAIAAIGQKRELGKGNELLWRIPDDLKRFRDTTRGFPCIMGRKTFDSIVTAIGKPLPSSPNIVVSRSEGLSTHDVFFVSHEKALETAQSFGLDKAFICGGAQIYELFMPVTTKLMLTEIDAEAEGADTFFPEYKNEFTKVVFEECHEFEGLKYRFVDLKR